MTNALITGITGQDGSYLAELLLNKGYTVYGMVRRLSIPNLKNIEGIKDKVHIIGGDLLDQASIMNAIKISQPDEIYHLGAQSFVATSWEQAELTLDTTGLGAMRIFEGARMAEDYIGKKIKIYQASSSEMYGNANGICPQNEETPMKPRSPYGVAKLMAHNLARVYRESYDMDIWCGILFNHESSKRGIEFVSQKIANGVARIKLGLDKELKLGNIRAKRDWGFAGDYVEAMWMMLNNDEKADDFVIASGENHSVREFCQIAFDIVGLDWEHFVKPDDNLYRPAEIFNLLGDYSKAKDKLGWSPKTSFQQLVNIMVGAQLWELGGHGRS
jgi:GDPmannose 4,6-dehydratase